VGFVVEPGVARLFQSLEEAADAVVPVVVAGELGKPRIDEVEHDVGRVQVLVGLGEAVLDEGSGAYDEIEIRLLCRWR